MAKTATRKKTARKATPQPQDTHGVTLYLTTAQHAWLRQQALDYSNANGQERPDNSATVRRLFDAAMKGKRSR